MQHYNVSGLREYIRTTTGVGQKGAVGDARLLRILNYALTMMLGEFPDAYLRWQWRFRAEPPTETGTVAVHSTDRLTMIHSGPIGTFNTDGSFAGRWIEIWDGTRWHKRRIQWIDGSGTKAPTDIIILDTPYVNNTGTGLTYRIYTDEYPIPADIKDVRSVIWSPDDGSADILYALEDNDMVWSRAQGWRDKGQPYRCALGNYEQLRAPHFTVGASVVELQPTNSQRWGWDDTGVEHHSTFSGARYGNAGTFSYIACLGLGRYKKLLQTNKDLLLPFYISAPCTESVQVTTTWGAGRITISLADAHYIYGYGATSTLPSYHNGGYEWWVFRARHANQASGGGNNAAVKTPEADGVYYLWRVVSGDTIAIYDKGDNDPIDVRYPLSWFHGHRSLRFDRLPTDDKDILAVCNVRPKQLERAEDVPRIAPEHMEAFLSLACSLAVGRRDGEPDIESLYYKRYKELQLAAIAGANAANTHIPARNGLRNVGRAFLRLDSVREV